MRMWLQKNQIKEVACSAGKRIQKKIGLMKLSFIFCISFFLVAVFRFCGSTTHPSGLIADNKTSRNLYISE